MFFGCSSKELEKFPKKLLILNALGLKRSKIDPQTLLKRSPTNVTRKLTKNCYSQSDSQLLL